MKQLNQKKHLHFPFSFFFLFHYLATQVKAVDLEAVSSQRWTCIQIDQFCLDAG